METTEAQSPLDPSVIGRIEFATRTNHRMLKSNAKEGVVLVSEDQAVANANEVATLTQHIGTIEQAPVFYAAFFESTLALLSLEQTQLALSAAASTYINKLKQDEIDRQANFAAPRTTHVM